MEQKDKKIKCVDCNRWFDFTVEEQKFYQEKEFKDPKRCRPCRKAKRVQREKKDEG